MNLLEKEKKIIDLIIGELNFVTDEDIFFDKPDYEVFLSQENLKEGKISNRESEKILQKMKSEKLIDSFEEDVRKIVGSSYFFGYNLVVNKTKFIRSIEKGVPEKKINSSIIRIHYNLNAGIGFVNDKSFRFKRKTDSFNIFALLYKKINKPILLQQLLESVQIKTKYHINNLAKQIRKNTGLDTTQLVQNSGSLTLVGAKVKHPPKRNQT